MHISKVVRKVLPRRYTPKNLSRLDEAILKTLAILQHHNGKKWVAIPQATLCLLLQRYYKLRCSRRTLNYHLAALEQRGYIKRIRRVRNGKGGKLQPLPTIYELTAKAKRFLKGLYKFIKRLFGRNAKQALQELFEKALEEWKTDRRFLSWLDPAQKSKVLLEIAGLRFL